MFVCFSPAPHIFTGRLRDVVAVAAQLLHIIHVAARKDDIRLMPALHDVAFFDLRRHCYTLIFAIADIDTCALPRVKYRI